MSENKSNLVEQHALDRIPDSERKSWVSIAAIWAGAMICVPMLMTGGVLISGLPLAQAILAGIIGYTIVVAFMSFQGMQGTDLGRPTVVTASSTFGKKGSSLIISFVIGIACMGWFGIQANVTGSAFSSILSNGFGVSMPIPLASAIWGIIMLTTAIIGYKALSYLNYIAVPALIILALYGTFSAISNYGLDALLASTPTTPFSFVTGVGIAVGGFAVGAVIAADYSRYAIDRKGSLLSSLVGVWPFGILLLVAGALMSAVAGSADITQVISQLGFPILGLIILILATWTTNAVNAYSGGLALTNMFNLNNDKRSLTTAIAGIIGTILAVSGILNYFVSFLIILTTAIPPVAGVMIADYWILHKGKVSDWKPTEGINWYAFIAWIAGFIVAYFVKWGIAPLNAIIVSIVIYLILSPAVKKNFNVKEGV